MLDSQEHRQLKSNKMPAFYSEMVLRHEAQGSKAAL